MRSHGLIIAPNIITDGDLSFSNILITALWHPFCLKASKESFCWGIVPTISATAHTLRHAITTDHGFSEYLTGVMSALIRVKQHATWL